MKYREQWIDHRAKKLNKGCGEEPGYNQFFLSNSG